MRAYSLGTAMITMAVLLAGCASSGNSSQGTSAPLSPPDIGSPPVPSGTAAPVLPLSAYADPGLTTVYQQAEQLLILSCMRARGFSYTVQPAQSVPSAGQQDLPYGITSLAYARQHAYGNGQLPPGHHFSARRVGSLHSAAYNLALTGSASAVPDNSQLNHSCTGEADRKLSTGSAMTSGYALVGQMEEKALSYSQADPRVLGAEHAWSRCMAARGFHYATPLTAADAAWSAKPDAEEISTAVADVSCKQRVNLAGIWNAVEAGYQRELIARNAAALASLASSISAQLRKAEKVVATQGGQH